MHDLFVYYEIRIIFDENFIYSIEKRMNTFKCTFFDGILLNKQDLSQFGIQQDGIVANIYNKFDIYYFNKLIGPFAFALQKANETILVRDQFGQKQLYYTDDGRYSTRMSDLLSSDMHTDMQALSEYLSLGYVPAPRTIKKEIHSVPAGCSVFIQGNRITCQRYFTPQFYPKTSLSYKEACEGIDALISQAVKRCLDAVDNPGILLSGGIDSNLMLHYVAAQQNIAPDTFTISFNDTAYNEANLAAVAASAVNSTHHIKLATPSDYSQMREFLRASGEPFADSSLLASGLVMKFAKEKKSAVIMGDGGDELFGGYKRYQFMAIRNALGGPVTAMGRPFAQLLRHILPKGTERRSRLTSIRRATDAFTMESIPCYASFQEIFSYAQVSQLCPALQDTLPYTDAWEHIASQLGSLDQAEIANGIDICTYLPEDGCRKDNVASQNAGITALSPLLDMELALFVFSLPRKYKTTLRETKRPLRTLAKGRIPDVLLTQPKRGFGIPVASWFRNELKEELLQLPQELPDIFDKDVVSKLIQVHLDGKADNGTKLWTLLSAKDYI